MLGFSRVGLLKSGSHRKSKQRQIGEKVNWRDFNSKKNLKFIKLLYTAVRNLQ